MAGEGQTVPRGPVSIGTGTFMAMEMQSLRIFLNPGVS